MNGDGKIIIFIAEYKLGQLLKSEVIRELGITRNIKYFSANRSSGWNLDHA